MVTMVKTKSQLRAETEKAVKQFLRSGGSIEQGKPARNRKSSMLGKNSRGFIGGTSGFATGYPRRSIGA